MYSLTENNQKFWNHLKYFHCFLVTSKHSLFPSTQVELPLSLNVNSAPHLTIPLSPPFISLSLWYYHGKVAGLGRSPIVSNVQPSYYLNDWPLGKSRFCKLGCAGRLLDNGFLKNHIFIYFRYILKVPLMCLKHIRYLLYWMGNKTWQCKSRKSKN